jgi:hypothetical protein
MYSTQQLLRFDVTLRIDCETTQQPTTTDLLDVCHLSDGYNDGFLVHSEGIQEIFQMPHDSLGYTSFDRTSRVTFHYGPNTRSAK